MVYDFRSMNFSLIDKKRKFCNDKLMDTSKEVTNCDRSRYFQLIFVAQIRFKAMQKRYIQICGREKSPYLQIEWVKKTDVK